MEAKTIRTSCNLYLYTVEFTKNITIIINTCIAACNCGFCAIIDSMMAGSSAIWVTICRCRCRCRCRRAFGGHPAIDPPNRQHQAKNRGGDHGQSQK